MGFGYFMYSYSLVPVIDLWISGRDKVGIRAWVFIADFEIIVLCFSYTTAVLGCQMLVMLSLLLVFCVVSILLLCFDFIWFVFSEWEGEHEMLLLLKQLIMLSSPFRVKLLFLLLNVEEEIAVVEECCFRLCLLVCDFRSGLIALIFFLYYFDC